jgi:DNA primase
MGDLQTVESSVSIVDIVSRYRTVVPAGKNFKSLCPFHDDHSPSLIINPLQNFAWCFACQNGGNVFSFIQKIEGLSFKESVKFIGSIGGVNTSFLDVHNDAESKEKKNYKEILKSLLNITQDYFVDSFNKNKSIQDYFYKKRSLSKSISYSFGIGYAKNSFDSLKNYLLEKGFLQKKCLMQGL